MKKELAEGLTAIVIIIMFVAMQAHADIVGGVLYGAKVVGKCRTSFNDNAEQTSLFQRSKSCPVRIYAQAVALANPTNPTVYPIPDLSGITNLIQTIYDEQGNYLDVRTVQVSLSEKGRGRIRVQLPKGTISKFGVGEVYPVDASKLNCDGLDAQATQQLIAARACQFDYECGQAVSDLGCGWGRSPVARENANLNSLYETLGQAEELGCELSIPQVTTCDVPETFGFICNQGTCDWNYDSGPRTM